MLAKRALGARRRRLVLRQFRPRRVTPVSLSLHSRLAGVSVACQSKAAKNTHTDQCTVGAGPLARSARSARGGAQRSSAKEAKIFPYLFAPSPVRLEGRSGNGSRSRPAEGPAARRAVPYAWARQASEKEKVMSFEEMAESAKSAGLPTEFKFDESSVRTVIKDGEPWFVAKASALSGTDPFPLGVADPSSAQVFVFDRRRGRAHFNLETAVGRCEVHSVSEISRLGCIRLGRGGAGRGGGVR